MDNEEEFLSTFFTLVSQLSFDKAKEIVERERESSRLGQPVSLGMLLAHLPQFSAAEKSYVELGSLLSKNKGFLRKDTSLRSTYEALRGDFRRLEEVANSDSRLVSTVAKQLSQFITARIQLIDFYEKMQVMGTCKVMKYEDLVAHIEDIMEKHTMSFSHLVLTSIKAALSLECEILAHLLRAHLEMQQWHMLPSLMLLHKATTRIAAWEQTLQNKDSWKLGFLKANQTPALFQWLIKLKAAYLSKFSLYFYATLSQQTSLLEIKTYLAKQSCDYLHKIQSFQKRYDATSIILVLDTKGLEDFTGPGYHLPDSPLENPCDMEPYHIIVSYPVKPLNHMTNVVKVLTEHAAELASMDRVTYFFSPKDLSTYVTATIDPRINLVVLFDSKKCEKDTYIGNFVSELSVQLRCNKVFSSLKPNAK